MGAEHRPIGKNARGRVFAFVALLVFSGIFSSLAQTQATEPDQPVQGPVGVSRPSLMEPPTYQGTDAETAWNQPVGGEIDEAGPRGAPPNELYTNGPVLNDFNDPASQLSLQADGAATIWRFNAAAADDFVIQDVVNPNVAAHITTVRAGFAFFNTGSASATPSTTWAHGVYVTIYSNTVGNTPNGAPLGNGSFSGPPVASQLVLTTAPGFVETAVTTGVCRNHFIVDIPVNMYVAKNTRYWLSIVPRYAAPPQAGWCLSSEIHDLDAVRGTNFDDHPFWTTIEGNSHAAACAGAPPAGSRKNLSFALFGLDADPTVSACCNTSTGVCTDVASDGQCVGQFDVFHPQTTCALVTAAGQCTQATGSCCNDQNPGGCTNNVVISACTGPNVRFTPNVLCANLDPPCGTTTPGACCMPGPTCADLSPTDCQNNGGKWHAQLCNDFTCPPDNNDCTHATTLLADGTYTFTTLGALTDGPPVAGSGCSNVDQDVWFRYIAGCTGNLTVSLCLDTDYDSALAVYTGCLCGANLGPLLGCNNDACGPASEVIVPVTANQCYLIRIGGNAAATGSGSLIIGCVPTGQGACCNASHQCTITTEAACQPPSVFTLGSPCSPITCPASEHDDCADAQTISGDGLYPFDTTGATTDGPPVSGTGCTDVNQDVWFAYTSTCTGQLFISLCDAANFDTALAVYNGCVCDPLGAQLACNDDACDTQSQLSIPVTLGQCFLIRVGGKGSAAGVGTLGVTCIPTGQGACCAVEGGCSLTIEADCSDPGDEFHLNLPCSPALCNVPENDNCDHPQVVSNGTHPFTNIHASTDGPADSAGPPCVNITNDVWFTYTATCDGNLVASLCLGTGFDAAIAVYDGCTCPPGLGPQLACDNDACGAGTGGEVSVPVINSNCYLIRVGSAAAATGTGNLIIGCVPTGNGACCQGPGNCALSSSEIDCTNIGGVFTLGQPCSPLTCPDEENDNCTGATPVGDGTYPFDTTDATTDGPSDATGITCTNVNHDLWFAYTASCDGVLKASLCDSNYDTAIAVYQGCTCSPLGALLGCDNNGCGPSGSSEAVVHVNNGQCYLIRVGGAGTAVGTGTLTLSCTTQSACCLGDVNGDNQINFDDVAAMVAILLADPQVPSSPAYCAADINADTFVDGNDIQPFSDLIIAGGTCPALVVGACCFTNGSCLEIAQADCLNTSGTYQGNGTICTPNPCDQPPGPPANDECSGATLITCGTPTAFTNELATENISDPSLSCRFGGPGQGFGTVWFQFVASDTSALLSLCNTTGTVTDTILAVFDGNGCPPTLGSQLACNEDAGGACGRLSELCVEGLTPANTYTVLVASFDADSQGEMTLSLLCPCPSGACCAPDGSCQLLRSDVCTSSGGIFHGNGTVCSPNPCQPPPIIACCAGDMNVDGVVNAADVDGFVTAILNPPSSGTVPFCLADADHNNIVNGADIAAFSALALASTNCAASNNDECANAMPIVCDTRVVVDNSQATTAVSDPVFPCRIGGAAQGVATLWFKFIATDTSASISTCLSEAPASDTLLAVYSGSCPFTVGNQLACNDDAGGGCGRLSKLCVNGLTINNTYYIQVASFNTLTKGYISVDLICPCP